MDRAGPWLHERFVERLGETTLHEYWRVLFCRRYFASRMALRGSAAIASESRDVFWEGEIVNTISGLDSLGGPGCRPSA